MRIVLMGPPGAGKGTQAKRLAERFGMRHLSSGDIFRAEQAGGSELGRTLGEYMEAGRLVPDDLVVEVMAKAITAGGDRRGLLLDGFPRTVEQARALDQQLDKAAAPLDAVVIINVDADRIVARITGRRSCPQCGKAYHVTFLPPRREGVCDACGTALVQREDDTEPVVRQRLDAYRRQTEPVLDYYRDRPDAAVLDIDGNGDPDEVTASVVAALRTFQAER